MIIKKDQLHGVQFQKIVMPKINPTFRNYIKYWCILQTQS
jgi:hypothetical protein